MLFIISKNEEAIEAYELVSALQKSFVDKLNYLSFLFGKNKKFKELNWFRDEGQHGGGNRFESEDDTLFNSASVNVSQVHYDDIKNKDFQSATSISTIIHPKNPLIPSMHMHISLTKLKDNNLYWRIMADLNPSIENFGDKVFFDRAIKKLTKDRYIEGTKQAEEYFFIPVLNRHRGVSHFYLEKHKTSNKKNDFNFAKNFGNGIIDTYIDIVTNTCNKAEDYSINEIMKQVDYHTLYLFQVLTLDRGTTSGLLVHNQNNLGIMASLPKLIKRSLLESWKNKLPSPQDELLTNILEVINERGSIDINTKEKLANVVREHYTKYKDALKL